MYTYTLFDLNKNVDDLTLQTGLDRYQQNCELVRRLDVGVQFTPEMDAEYGRQLHARHLPEESYVQVIQECEAFKTQSFADQTYERQCEVFTKMATHAEVLEAMICETLVKPRKIIGDFIGMSKLATAVMTGDSQADLNSNIFQRYTLRYPFRHSDV